MYVSEIIWGRSEIFGRRRREGWLGFTVLLEIFLSLACSDIAHDRHPFTIQEPLWACKLTMKDKAATCMTKCQWTVPCVAITQPCLWLRQIPSWFCVSHKMKSKTKEICRCQCSLGGISSLASKKKISKEMICRFSEFKKLHVIYNKKEG